MQFKLIEDAGVESWWYNHEAAAGVAWNSAPGPQLVSWSTNPYESWDYFDYSSTNDHANTSHTYAVTYNCDANNTCTNSGLNPMNIKYSHIWINHNHVDSLTSQQGYIFDSAMIHEIGHTMGLLHNYNAGEASVMEDPIVNNYQAPQTADLGSTNLCSGTKPGGVRCVFGFAG